MKKKWSNAYLLIMLLLAAVGYTACGTAGGIQGSNVNADSLLQTRRFVFIPQSVNPTGGRTRQVTPDFFLRVSPDTVQSYLPYFGRAYTAPINSGRGGMDFTLTGFEYIVTPGNKNRQQITIRPQSGADIRELVLQVNPNGYATLIALSNNRQQISYNGYIQSRLR
jgi:hypothetical protein